MRFAEDSVLVNAKLLARRELAFAGVAGEAGQMVDLIPGLTHPVRGADGSATLEAFRTEKPSETDNFKFTK